MKKPQRTLAIAAVLATATIVWLWIASQPGGIDVKTRTQKDVNVAIVYSEDYGISLGGLEKLHSFDIHKYKRIYKQLLMDELIDPAHVYRPDEISEVDILRVHSKAFLQSLESTKTVARYLEAPAMKVLPRSMVESGVLSPFRRATGGTLLAARHALKCGVGINLGGGYHHAKPESGEGFCIYPIPKAKSDLDVELESGTGDLEYLKLLRECLPKAFNAAGSVDMVIYQAGCDTLEGDPLASLTMTEEGIVMRDALVIDACVDRGIPVVMTLGGGYGKNAWHAQYRSIKAILEMYGQAMSGND